MKGWECWVDGSQTSSLRRSLWSWRSSWWDTIWGGIGGTGRPSLGRKTRQGGVQQSFTVIVQQLISFSIFERLAASEEYYQPFVVFTAGETEGGWRREPVEELPPNLQLLSFRRETRDTIILRLTANILQMLTCLEFTFSLKVGAHLPNQWASNTQRASVI